MHLNAFDEKKNTWIGKRFLLLWLLLMVIFTLTAFILIVSLNPFRKLLCFINRIEFQLTHMGLHIGNVNFPNCGHSWNSWFRFCIWLFHCVNSVVFSINNFLLSPPFFMQFPFLLSILNIQQTPYNDFLRSIFLCEK